MVYSSVVTVVKCLFSNSRFLRLFLGEGMKLLFFYYMTCPYVIPKSVLIWDNCFASLYICKI